jgi:hypothetical protein
MTTDDLTRDIVEALRDYAATEIITKNDLPLCNPGFDAALDQARGKIRRALGPSEPRFHADLRDLATQSLPDPDEALIYILVSGAAAHVETFLREPAAMRRYLAGLRRRWDLHADTALRFARYALTPTEIAPLSPGQISRIARQFHDPLCGFDDYAGLTVPPVRTQGDIRLVIAHRRRAVPGRADGFDRIREPHKTAYWDLMALDQSPPSLTGPLSIQVKASWSDIAIATAVEIVRTALFDAPIDVQWDLAQGRARLVGFTHPDQRQIEIVAVGESGESDPILVPHGLIAHRRYGFDQALLDLAPLQMDGQTVC